MKLCIVTPNVTKGDGQGRANYEIAWEAIRRGHHVTLLSTNVAIDLQQSSQVDWIFIPVAGWPTELLRHLVRTWRNTNWLRKHRLEFDLVNVNGAITRTQADVNAVHFVHTSWLQSPVHTSRLRRDFYGAYHWLYTGLNARWEKESFRQAKVLVAVSKKVREELIDIGVPQESIRVILNGVDLHEFSPGDADRRKWGIPSEITLALFVGDIRSPRKNLDTVLHALVEVPELHLAVVGSTEGSPYPQLAAKLALEERVHFLGFRQDVPELMKAVDFLVFPSHYETFGLVVIEAMASGLPVITATTTGAAELITPECGVVLPKSGDIHALAQSLSILKSDRSGWKRMGASGREIAEQHSWLSMARSYIDLFEELSKS